MSQEQSDVEGVDKQYPDEQFEAIAESHSDFDSACERLKNISNLEVTPLGIESSGLSFEMFSVGSIAIYSLKFPAKFLLRGERHPGLISLMPIDEVASGGLSMGNVVHPGDVLLGDPGTEIDGVANQGNVFYGVTLSAEDVRSMVCHQADEELPSLFAQTSILHLEPIQVRALSERLRATLHQVFEEGKQPGSADELLEHLLMPWLPKLGIVRKLSHQSRLNIVREAEEMMRAHLSVPLGMTTIFKELKVSRRTLFYAFQSVYGVTPLEFYKRLRLTHAYRLLRTSTEQVKNISRSVGYLHAGQFAREFRSLFGVSPSKIEL